MFTDCTSEDVSIIKPVKLHSRTTIELTYSEVEFLVKKYFGLLKYNCKLSWDSKENTVDIDYEIYTLLNFYKYTKYVKMKLTKTDIENVLFGYFDSPGHVRILPQEDFPGFFFRLELSKTVSIDLNTGAKIQD